MKDENKKEEKLSKVEKVKLSFLSMFVIVIAVILGLLASNPGILERLETGAVIEHYKYGVVKEKHYQIPQRIYGLGVTTGGNVAATSSRIPETFVIIIEEEPYKVSKEIYGYVDEGVRVKYIVDERSIEGDKLEYIEILEEEEVQNQ